MLKHIIVVFICTLIALPEVESQANTGIVDVTDTLARNLGLADLDKFDKLNLVDIDEIFVDHDNESFLFVVKTSDDNGVNILTKVLRFKHVLSLKVLTLVASELNVLLFKFHICRFA